MGDASPEALQVLALKVYLLLDPLLRGSRGPLVCLHKVIELFMNTITVPHEVVQMVLSVTPIFIEAMADNLSKREGLGPCQGPPSSRLATLARHGWERGTVSL